jgi:hypothetical protein
MVALEVTGQPCRGTAKQALSSPSYCGYATSPCPSFNGKLLFLNWHICVIFFQGLKNSEIWFIIWIIGTEPCRTELNLEHLKNFEFKKAGSWKLLKRLVKFDYTSHLHSCSTQVFQCFATQITQTKLLSQQVPTLNLSNSVLNHFWRIFYIP